MVDSRGKGGAPQGNLNAAKNVLSALARLGRGKPLPPELNRVTMMANQEASELISDKGGWDNMSGAERLMVSNWKSARKAELLIWSELLERGPVQVKQDGSWDLQPGAQRFSSILVGSAGRPVGTRPRAARKGAGSEGIHCRKSWVASTPEQSAR